MSTPTPRTSAAIIASGFQAVPEGFRAFAGNLERELAALTAERDQLRAALALGQKNCDDAYDDLRAERDAARARAERAEADLAKERARLDWLQEHALAQHSEGISISKLGRHYNGFPGSLRAAIDAAMKGAA